MFKRTVTINLYCILHKNINMLQPNYVAELKSLKDSQNNRSSDSTTATQDESLSPCLPLRCKNLVVRNDDPKLQIFRASKTAGEISQKLAEKAITWIQITGFTKNLCFQTIVYSIALFYASLNKLSVSKKNLQATISACMFLGSKAMNRSELSMNDILTLIENREPITHIIKIQKNILQALDFNLHFSLPLFQALQDLSCQIQQQKLKFLSEILLIKDPCLLYDADKVQEIVELSRLPQIGSDGKLSHKVHKILKKNSCQHIIKKYQSKFNVGEYIIQPDHISDFI